MTLDAEEIINYYKDKYGYVTDIDSIIEFFKQDKTITNKEKSEILLSILRWNLKIDKENKEKLKGFKKKEERQETKEINNPTLEIDKKESEFFEASSYIHSIKECDDDDFITEILPTIYDNNYESIIGSILLYFLRELSLANDMLAIETNEEDQLYLKNVIKRNKEIINIIKKYNNEEENETTLNTTQEHNKLIFLRKKNSSLYIKDDLDNTATEEDLLPILNDIITGNFTKEKRFHNNDDLKGLSAIRRRDSRIIFVRLNNNIILILGILVKRFQNPQTYRDMLKARNKEFKLQKDILKENINNEEFLNCNKEIQEEIIKELNSRKKILKEA